MLEGLAAAGATALLAAIGYLLKRYFSHSGRQEKVALYQSTADLMIKLKESGLSIEDVDNFSVSIRAAIRQSTIRDTSNSLGDEFPRVWTQSHMNASAEAEFAVLDARLAEALVQLSGLLTDDEETLLSEAQNLWIAYRDAEALFIASEFTGGTMQPLIYAGELSSLTEDRIKRVRATIAERESRTSR